MPEERPEASKLGSQGEFGTEIEDREPEPAEYDGQGPRRDVSHEDPTPLRYEQLAMASATPTIPGSPTAFPLERTRLVVWNADADCLGLEDVRVHSHKVVGEVCVVDASVARVEFAHRADPRIPRLTPSRSKPSPAHAEGHDHSLDRPIEFDGAAELTGDAPADELASEACLPFGDGNGRTAFFREVKRLLTAVPDWRMRTLLTTAYAAGLRVAEVIGKPGSVFKAVCGREAGAVQREWPRMGLDPYRSPSQRGAA